MRMLPLVLTMVLVGCGEGSPENQSLENETLRVPNPCLDEEGRATHVEGWARCGLIRGLRQGHIELADQDLTGIWIERSGFRGGDFENTILDRAQISESQMPYGNFRNAQLRGVYFSTVVLTDANLSGADLRGSVLNSVNLIDVDLRGADLRGVSFDGNTVWSWAVYDQTTCLPFSDEEARWRGLIKEFSIGVNERNCLKKYQITAR